MRNKMRGITIFLSFLIFFCVFAVQTHAVEIINVTSYGATPNDGKDDTKALRKTVAYCRTRPGCTLLIPPGVYQLKDEAAVKLEKEVLNGEMGANPEKVVFTPYYPYSKGLDFTGSKDLTIQADGATLLCEGWMEPVCLDSCANITLKGLTINYKRKPFSTGEVIAIEKDYFDVQFTNERIITDNIPLMRILFWDKVKNRMYPKPLNFPKRELLGNNIVRFHKQIPKELLGANASAIHSFHFRPAILICNSQEITLEGVTVHSQPGMGIVGFDSRDIILKRLSIVPAPGYYISTNTDATHFACCEGLLRFEGCMFRGQGDDATNVHGYYQSILSAVKNKANIEVRARTYTHAQVADVPRVNDEMELVEVKTLKPVRIYKVTGVVHKPKAIGSEVTLSDNLPENIGDYYLMNVTKLPRLEFENSLVDSHMARGILVKTRNVLINNNVFRNGSGTAIHVGAESSWKEGSHARNVIITNNVMSGCGSGAGAQGGASGIAVIIESEDAEATYIHENIRIENNLILGEGNPCGIYVGNAKEVILKHNRVINCNQDYITHSTNGLSIIE